MAGDLNRVTLIGRLGADPELRRLQNGNAVCNLRVATKEEWKDRETGEKKEKVEWSRVTIWGPLAEIADKSLKKGSRVFVEGKLQTRKWQDQQGQDKYSTDIVLQGFDAKLIFLDGKKPDGAGRSGDQGGFDEGGYGDPEPSTKPKPAAAKPATRDDMDDSIPF